MTRDDDGWKARFNTDGHDRRVDGGIDANRVGMLTSGLRWTTPRWWSSSRATSTLLATATKAEDVICRGRLMVHTMRGMTVRHMA
jgi:hypothetical protein